jgi:hypothetical protein
MIPSFSIELHRKDLTVLNNIQLFVFFSVGKIRNRNRNG